MGQPGGVDDKRRDARGGRVERRDAVDDGPPILPAEPRRNRKEREKIAGNRRQLGCRKSGQQARQSVTAGRGSRHSRRVAHGLSLIWIMKRGTSTRRVFTPRLTHWTIRPVQRPNGRIAADTFQPVGRSELRSSIEVGPGGRGLRLCPTAAGLSGPVASLRPGRPEAEPPTSSPCFQLRGRGRLAGGDGPRGSPARPSPGPRPAHARPTPGPRRAPAASARPSATRRPGGTGARRPARSSYRSSGSKAISTKLDRGAKRPPGRPASNTRRYRPQMASVGRTN